MSKRSEQVAREAARQYSCRNAPERRTRGAEDMSYYDRLRTAKSPHVKDEEE